MQRPRFAIGNGTLGRALRAFTPLAGLLACTAACSAVINPSTLRQALAGAQGGQTIILGPGEYGPIAIRPGIYQPKLVIDASAATFTALTLRGVSGVDVKGGTLLTSPDQTFGVIIDRARDVHVADMTIGGARIGVTIVRSQDIVVADNRLDGLRSDGINVSQAQRVRIERNSCRNFKPIPPIYADDGKLVKDGDHPDCIQGWSVAGAPLTTDISVIDNTAEGFMQGIFFNNPKLRSGVSDGYERMIIRGNTVRLSAFNGIILQDVRNAEVTGNTVLTIPGSLLAAYPHPKIRTWLRVSGRDIRSCDNKVEAWPSGEGTGRCRDRDKGQDSGTR